MLTCQKSTFHKLSIVLNAWFRLRNYSLIGSWKLYHNLAFKIRELGFLEDRVEIKSHSVKTIDGSAEHHSRVGEQRCMSQAAASAAPDEQRCMSQATRIASEPTWASTDLLEVIEEVPYHELFFLNFEELVPRS